ncbi:MAG TPA: hypothetical protein VGQ75_09895 [Thermoanaerobaculia bacterium]|nr:hypothetical protein [Thermoanaerobaculia bacterium]HEV8609193.1 hypothetical protein [Thermoanaerobaculia bacterium]
MSRLPAFRYFAAVSPPPATLTAVFAILAVGAGALEAVDRGSSDWVLASIAMVQLFAASTGFTRHATRGYYDPVLIGNGRTRVALAHFAASAAPGALAWLACGACQAVAARSASVPALRPGGWVTLLLVSGIPWAATVRGAPFLGGTLWLLLSVSLVAAGKVLGPLGRLHVQPSWAGDQPLAAFGLGLAFPAAIPTLEWPRAILLAFAATATLAVAGGALLIARADLGLAEEGS